MSYILDALQKSQRDRELGKVPTLTSEHFEQPVNESGINRLTISLMVMVLVAMAIAAYFIMKRPDQVIVANVPVTKAIETPVKTETVKSEAPKIELPSVSPAVTSKPAAESTPKTQPVEFEEPQETTEAAKPEVTTPASKISKPALRADLAAYRQEMLDLIAEEEKQAASKTVEVQPAPIAKPQPEPVAETWRQPPESKPRPKPKPVSKTKHYPLQRALPAAVAKRIPEQRVIVHVYSETPANRYVILNSTRMSEGDKTSDGLKIIEIRQNGLILEFEGHKFLSPR